MSDEGLFSGETVVSEASASNESSAADPKSVAPQTNGPAVEDGYNPSLEDLERSVDRISARNRAEGTIRGEVEGIPQELVWGNGEKFEFDLTGIEEFDPTKYQKPEDVIRHNLSMRKKISEFKPAPTAPEQYEVDPDVFNTEDPFLKEFSDLAKEASLPQETYEKILQFAVDQSTLAEQEAKKEAEAKEEAWRQEQLQLLGDNPQHRWQKISEWAAKELPEEMQDVMAANVKSAADVQLWEYMISKRHDYTPPPGRSVGAKPQGEQLSRAKLNELMSSQDFVQGKPGAVKEVHEYAKRLRNSNAR
jgi:hypothetical protein